MKLYYDRQIRGAYHELEQVRKIISKTTEHTNAAAVAIHNDRQLVYLR